MKELTRRQEKNKETSQIKEREKGDGGERQGPRRRKQCRGKTVNKEKRERRTTYEGKRQISARRNITKKGERPHFVFVLSLPLLSSLSKFFQVPL
jgi:hypothetical protein